MNNVVGQVMLAAEIKNLATADGETLTQRRITGKYSLRARQPQIATGMRFRQAHGGQPFTAGDF